MKSKLSRLPRSLTRGAVFESNHRRFAQDAFASGRVNLPHVSNATLDAQHRHPADSATHRHGLGKTRTRFRPRRTIPRPTATPAPARRPTVDPRRTASARSSTSWCKSVAAALRGLRIQLRRIGPRRFLFRHDLFRKTASHFSGSCPSAALPLPCRRAGRRVWRAADKAVSFPRSGISPARRRTCRAARCRS